MNLPPFADEELETIGAWLKEDGRRFCVERRRRSPATSTPVTSTIRTPTVCTAVPDT